MYIHIYLNYMFQSFYRFSHSIDCITQSVDQQNSCHSIDWHAFYRMCHQQSAQYTICRMRNAICRFDFNYHYFLFGWMHRMLWMVSIIQSVWKYHNMIWKISVCYNVCLSFKMLMPLSCLVIKSMYNDHNILGHSC